MSDHTPTTDEVRADYVRDHTRGYDEYQGDRTMTAVQEQYGAEFDAWIAQHDREVQAETLEAEAAKIESKRSLLGIASRALDIGQAWSAALLRGDAKRLRDGGAA